MNSAERDAKKKKEVLLQRTWLEGGWWVGERRRERAQVSRKAATILLTDPSHHETELEIIFLYSDATLLPLFPGPRLVFL